MATPMDEMLVSMGWIKMRCIECKRDFLVAENHVPSDGELQCPFDGSLSSRV